MLHHIKNCTKDEAHRQLGENEWLTTLDELDAFISILYARGIFGAINLQLDSLWSVVLGPLFSAILWREIDSENLWNFCDSTKHYTIWMPSKR
ncbi:hypothetical protein TNCV_1924671 [Trichonephila clavipes]|nr:hypothetical protein TNCV_1924671 [Trichonephila clavipes]